MISYLFCLQKREQTGAAPAVGAAALAAAAAMAGATAAAAAEGGVGAAAAVEARASALGGALPLDIPPPLAPAVVAAAVVRLGVPRAPLVPALVP